MEVGVNHLFCIDPRVLILDGLDPQVQRLVLNG
jgi:hypothetical protein